MKLHASPLARRTDTLAKELLRLWGVQRGFPDFHPAWLAFLSEPELSPFGEFVRDCAYEDAVIWGLWQDILFGHVGVARRVMGRGRVDQFVDGLRRGVAVQLWPEARQHAAELLVYLYLHPMSRVGMPPTDWQGPYAEIREGFPDIVSSAPQSVGAAKKIAYFLAAAVPWKSAGGRAAPRCKAWVDEAVAAGLLSQTGPPTSRTWRDPRTDTSNPVAGHRARWAKEHAEWRPATIGPDHAKAVPSERGARIELIKKFLGARDASTATLRALGVNEATMVALLLTNDPDALAATLTAARSRITRRAAQRVAAAVMVRRGESEASVAKRLGVPPKAVRGWVRECDASGELRALVSKIAGESR